MSNIIAGNTYNRNYAVDALRFLFIIIICILHFPVGSNPWFHRGYLGVDFFFMLSGYFIFQSYRKHNDVGTLDFTIKKIKRFVIPFYISICLLMLLDRKQYLYIHGFSPDLLLESFYTHFHEFFFCQSLGFTNIHAINGPAWFACVLLLGGALLYSLLRNYKEKALSFFIPTIIFVGIDVEVRNNAAGFSHALLRGVLDMGIGIELAYLVIRKSSMFRNHIILINVLNFVSILGMYLAMQSTKNYDYLVFFFSPLIILSAVTPQSHFYKLFSSSIWGKLGRVSMEIYFIHIFWANLFFIVLGFNCFIAELPSSLIYIIYLIIVVSSAFLINLISNIIRRLIFK